MTQTTIEDEDELITEAKQNPEKFKTLYEKYFKKIFLFIYNRVDDKALASDITSDVFLKAMINIPKYKPRGVPFSAWLYRIAINELNMFFRKSKRTRQIIIDYKFLETMEVSINNNLTEIQEQKLLKVLKNLTHQEMYIIELRFYHNLSFKEIALILKIKENNAKVRTYRLLDKLKINFLAIYD